MGLILVDSSVWIDLLIDKATLQTLALREFLDRKRPLAIGDLVLTEVLQGTRDDRQFARAQSLLSAFIPVMIAGPQVAIEAARNYRRLRDTGVTIRKTIDTLIATRCIVDNISLLYRDRDFDPFVEHLGLIPALATSGAT